MRKLWHPPSSQVRSVSLASLGVAASVAVAVVVGASCAGGGSTASTSTASTTTVAARTEPITDIANEDQVRLDGLTFEVHRDPGCGCCVSWVEYLQRHGATVAVSEDADRATFRSGLGISDAATSCHTAVVDGYAIEGHVPIAAIERLLADRPDAVGLALAGMPGDSPGMGGDMASWAELPVVLVSADGKLTPFDY